MTSFYLIMGMALIGGCKTPPSEPPAFLPGLYVSQTENEFCKITDTLVIRKTALNGAGYLVTRKSSFQRIKEGKEMPAEFRSEEWQAGYDDRQGLLISPTKADKIRYVRDSNKVYKRDFEYQKVE